MEENLNLEQKDCHRPFQGNFHRESVGLLVVL